MVLAEPAPHRGAVTGLYLSYRIMFLHILAVLIFAQQFSVALLHARVKYGFLSILYCTHSTSQKERPSYVTVGRTWDYLSRLSRDKRW